MTARAPNGAGARAAAVLVTDESFLFGTLFVAHRLARALGPADATDVIVFVVDPAPGRLDALRRGLEARGRPGAALSVRALDSRAWARAAGVERHRSHIPLASLARLVLGEHLEPAYGRIVYVDGDTVPLADPTPLLRAVPDPGRLIAANDVPYLFADDRVGAGRRLRPWLATLGIDAPGRYFNAGVMVLSREVLDVDFPRALDYFLSHPERCPYLDQCALNALLHERRDAMSPLWNFLSDYALCGIDRHHAPRLVHATGQVKPWAVEAPPWGGRFEPLYAAFESEAAALGVARPRMDRGRARHLRLVQARRASRVRALTPWRPWLRRRRFERHLAATAFALA